MNPESKIKFLKQLIYISSAFCILVAFLLVFNFWQMKSNRPLESKSIEALYNRLSEDPNNEDLRKEIRDFDLLARKAYFTSVWQVKTGAILLFFGAVVLAVSIKMKSDIEEKITLPESTSENPLKNSLISHRWLLITGGIIFLTALTSAFLSKNFLKDYNPEQTAKVENSTSKDSIEVVKITPAVTSSGVSTDTAKNIPVQTTPSETKPVNFKVSDFRENQSTFRGFLGQGISFKKNIPTDWDGSSGKNVKWKISLSLPGYNSPIIWKDKIFVAGADKTSRMVSCFDRNSGKLLWEKQADNIPGSPATPPKVTDDTGLSAPTLTTDGKTVVALFATGDIIAFDLQGNRIWAKNLGVPVNHYGHSSSLITWNGKIIVQYDSSKGGRMLALNSGTGDIIWDIKRDNKISWSSPVLFEKDGKMQIITSTDPNIAGYDLESGNELWKVAAMSGEVAPSPAILNGTVFATNEYAKTVAIDIASAKILWETDEYLSEVSSPVAYNDLLFLATSFGVLVCYDAKTGENVWEKQFETGFYSSPMIAENKVYIIDMKGIMHILKADRSATIIAEPALGEAAFAIPAFADGRIYIRGNKSLYCIGN